jgi:hypothetical protein
MATTRIRNRKRISHEYFTFSTQCSDPGDTSIFPGRRSGGPLRQSDDVFSRGRTSDVRPPDCATKIEAEGISAGERFELCKAQIKNGHGRSVEWALRRLAPEEQLDEIAPDAPAPDTPIERDLRLSVEMANAKKASSELPESPPSPPAQATLITNGNGNGTRESTVPASPVPVTTQNGQPQPRPLTSSNTRSRPPSQPPTMPKSTGLSWATWSVSTRTRSSPWRSRS